MRSLRLRFFLITWPLTVVAVVGVALAFDRWTEVRLTQQFVAAPSRARMAERVDSVIRPWAAGEIPASLLADRLREFAISDSIELAVVDSLGVIVAAASPAITTPGSGQLPAPGRPIAFERRRTRGDRTVLERVEVTGRPVTTLSGTVRAYVYRLPSDQAPPISPEVALRADVRSTLFTAVAIASALAAILALLLAGPLVAQVGRLGAASREVRAGNLATRVAISSTDELGKLEGAFNDMTSALQHAETHKRNLVHDVAHDLRTPLTNIVGMLEAIEDGLRAPDAATLNIVRSEAALLVALVNDLQELSLAESGQLTFDMVAVDAVAESAAAMDAMRASAGERRLEAPVEGPVWVRADARRLGQVLRNLLRNAISFTPPQGTITMSVTQSGEEVCIAVTDSGTGIPAEHIDLIWERLHRVDPARERSGGGHGLGLAIVRQFVERMAGRVAVTSEVGVGSRFEVWLRRETASSDR